MCLTSPFMKLADFDFHLPEDRIALRPASPRDSARLLLIAPGAPLEDLAVRDPKMHAALELFFQSGGTDESKLTIQE